MPEAGEVPRVAIDRDVCMGSGVCVVYAPGAFTQDAESKAVLVVPVSDSAEQIRVAVEACPTGALRIWPTDEESER
jgi:ferredoxin